MQINIPFRFGTLLALACLSGACETTTSNKGAATGKDITTAADEIQVGIGQLDATLASLASLVNQPAADLKPQYEAFSKNLSHLESTSKKLREVAQSMESKGMAYFADWDAQIAAIQNEDIRERSEERRAAVEEELADIKADYRSAQEEFHPLMNDLLDIRTALGADLTMTGLDTVKKSVKQADGHAEDVRETLQELSASFRELGVKMSNAGPPPAAPEQN